jgi:hypothetical protein
MAGGMILVVGVPVNAAVTALLRAVAAGVERRRPAQLRPLASS